MLERLQTMSLFVTDPDETAALSTLQFYFDAIVQMTIVGVSVAPLEDDAGATLDIDDDGTNVISAVDASDANVPGTWKTPGFGGGTNAPVVIDAGSKVALDFNSAAAANGFVVIIWYLAGEATT